MEQPDNDEAGVRRQLFAHIHVLSYTQKLGGLKDDAVSASFVSSIKKGD